MRDEKLRLLVLCGYPSDVRPSHQPFVRALLRALAAQGAEPTVLAPESWWARRRAPRFELRDGLPVHRPGFASFSAVRVPGLGSGERGQAKSRMIRALVALLDEWLPVVAGSEIHDVPFAPVSAAAKQWLAGRGDAVEIRWLHRDERYAEKLATPDVTIADLIGDVDPIKVPRAARSATSSRSTSA